MSDLQLQQAIGSLQSALERASDAIDTKLLRTKQKDTFLCSAKCCDTESKRANLQSCLERCSRPMMEVEQKVHYIFEDFQMRHQRCIQRCRDLAMENVSPSQSYVSGGDQEKAEASLRKCAIECCSSYEKQIPQLQKSILNS